MKTYTKPSKPLVQKIPNKDNNLSNWTLSYRLKGLALALALAGIYNYLYLPDWSYRLLIGSVILGYFLGWLVGRFYYTKH